MKVQKVWSRYRPTEHQHCNSLKNSHIVESTLCHTLSTEAELYNPHMSEFMAGLLYCIALVCVWNWKIVVCIVKWDQ